MKKGCKGLHERVANTSQDHNLTPLEEETLRLITEEFLTVKQISYRRKCTTQAVYKIIKKLKKKGAFNTGLQRVAKIQPTLQPSDKIRLHGQEFNIKLLYQDQFYQKLLNRSNIMFIDGNTIRLYRNSIEIYSGKDFYGENEQVATTRSLKYWKSFFIKLEHALRSVLVKPRSRNIKLVNQHYAYVNSEICENAIDRGERIRIYAKEDGKLAFITDDSFGLKEDETVHPKTAKQDRKIIDKQVNDWRLNDPPTNSQLSQNIMQVTDNQMLFAKEMANYGCHIKSHIKAIQDLGSSVQELTKLIKELKK